MKMYFLKYEIVITRNGVTWQPLKIKNVFFLWDCRASLAMTKRQPMQPQYMSLRATERSATITPYVIASEARQSHILDCHCEEWSDVAIS